MFRDLLFWTVVLQETKTANKLFIGNLSFKVADAELSELFASLNIPVASVTVMREVDTGRSRGFAFAELAPQALQQFQQPTGRTKDSNAPSLPNGGCQSIHRRANLNYLPITLN